MNDGNVSTVWIFTGILTYDNNNAYFCINKSDDYYLRQMRAGINKPRIITRPCMSPRLYKVFLTVLLQSTAFMVSFSLVEGSCSSFYLFILSKWPKTHLPSTKWQAQQVNIMEYLAAGEADISLRTQWRGTITFTPLSREVMKVWTKFSAAVLETNGRRQQCSWCALRAGQRRWFGLIA